MMLKIALNDTLKFSIRLLLWLSIVCALHIGINFFLKIDSTQHLLPLAYLLNFVLVLISYFGIMLAKAKGSHSLGYFFLAGFFVKIAVFIVFFNPMYKADGDIIPQEFFAFFTSYAFCLFYETKNIVKILNNS